MFDGAAWLRFMKRRELLCWKAYNLRFQVQRIILLGKEQSGAALTRIAEKLKAENLPLRSYRNVNAYESSSADHEADSGESESGQGNESEESAQESGNESDAFSTPMP